MTDPEVPNASPESPVTQSDPLVIRSLTFAGPMATVDGWRPEPRLPEIAFAGRSNVGKSSLLNALVKRKAFARVSRTPGRTRELNFFNVNDQFMLVDLPGYGYAKISKERKAAWRPLISSYLHNSPYLRGVVLLLDVRHDPTADDRLMLETLGDIGVPTLIALTKVDKLGTQARAKRIRELCAKASLDEEQVIPFSAHSNIGRDDLAGTLMALLDAGPWREEPVYVPKVEGSTEPPVFDATIDDAPFDPAEGDGDGERDDDE